MRNNVEQRVVTLMADARNDGQRELRAVVRKVLGIEAREVARGTAATNDDNHIP